MRQACDGVDGVELGVDVDGVHGQVLGELAATVGVWRELQAVAGARHEPMIIHSTDRNIKETWVE